MPVPPSAARATRSRRPIPGWVWAIAAGVLLRFVLVFAVPVFPLVGNTWDSNFYHETAANLASGEGYTFQGKPTAYYPPGFPAALSLVYRVTGPSPRAGQLMNALLSLGIVGVGAWLAGSALGRRGAALVAATLALDPSQIVMPAFLMSEVVCGLSTLLALAALLRGWRGGGAGWFALAAVAGAMAGLTRTHVFALLPAIALALFLLSRRSGRNLVLALALMGIADGAVIGGWALRNRTALGHPVPFATNGAVNFLLGNNPNSWGGRAEPDGGVPQTGDEVRDEAIARAQALDFIREHPARTVATLPLKAGRLVAFAPALTYRAEIRAKAGPVVAAVALVAAQLFHLGVWGMALLFLVRRARRAANPPSDAFVVAAGAIVVWTMAHLPFLGGARYFFPVEPLLVIAAVEAWGSFAASLRPARP